jgi:hypothetical protein
MKKHEIKNLAKPEQVLDLQRILGRKMLKMMTKQQADQILLTDASQKAWVNKFAKEMITNICNSALHPNVPKLIEYFQTVFGKDYAAAIQSMQFPEKEGMSTHMYRSLEMSENEIFDGLVKYFGVGFHKYKDSISKNIDHAEQDRIQPRPSTDYIFAHTGSQESDAQHKGKSYNDFSTEKTQYMIAAEYYLVAGFHKFVTGEWMDVNGWTRTATLWSDGYLLCAFWIPDSALLCANFGVRDYRGSGNGPREISF